MGKNNFVRHRFSVPNEDESVHEWIACQSNLSVSIRQLIKDYIRVHGMTDATCAPVEQQRKVGRPSNAELAARESMQQNNSVQNGIMKANSNPALHEAFTNEGYQVHTLEPSSSNTSSVQSPNVQQSYGQVAPQPIQQSVPNTENMSDTLKSLLQ